MHAQLIAQPFAGDANLHDFVARVVEDRSFRSLTVVVAWAKRSGLRHLRPPIEDFRRRGGESRIIVGIDEGGATRQGLEMTRELFGQVHVFHDRSGRTFHPKIYLAQGDATAELLVGSNNLTAGGIFFNYEAGLRCILDLARTEDVDLLDSALGYISGLYADSGVCIALDDHVFERLIRDPRYRIGDEDAIRQLQELDTPENYDSDVDMIDDSQVRSPVSPYTSSLFSRSSRRKRGAPSRSEEASLVEHARRSAGVIEQVTPQPISPPSEAPVTKRWFKRMTRTDAQRPPQSNSNPTGDLRLVQARHPIEQTTYFREDFFGSLDWTSRPGSRGPIDETIVPFHVLIDDVDHGMNELKVSNKPSGEAGQRNYTSGLHWGPLTPVLASGEFTGHFVILERLDDGTYRLILTRDEPGPFIR